MDSIIYNIAIDIQIGNDTINVSLDTGGSAPFWTPSQNCQVMIYEDTKDDRIMCYITPTKKKNETNVLKNSNK
jgi:pantothenate kinase